MAIDFNGTTDYLSGASTLLTNEPIDLTIHGNCDVATGNNGAMSLNNTGGASGGWRIGWRGDVASDPIRAAKESDAAAAGVADSIGYTAGTWFIGGASFINNTSRASFINGGTKGSDVTNIADPTPDVISIGAILTSAAGSFFNGKLAEAYVLDVNVSDALRAIYEANGISYIWTIPPANIRAWYPLHNVADLRNRVGGGYPNLTATGTPASAAHPANVVYPSINGLITC